MFAAVIVVVQSLMTFVWPGVIPMNLALPVIVMGALLYGPVAGGFLGFAFATIVIWSGISGTAPTSYMMWQTRPILMVLSNIIRGISIGVIPALLYRATSKSDLNVRTLVAASVTPIVNTGIFVFTLVMFYRDSLTIGDTSLLYHVFIVMTGTNFLLEMVVNIGLVTVIATVIRAVSKTHKAEFSRD